MVSHIPPSLPRTNTFCTINLNLQLLTESPDYRRFVDQWTFCHIADAALRGMPFAPNRIELPMPALRSGQVAYELDATEAARSLPNIPTVLEPGNSDRGS